ncbi:MAG: hypothetical protein Q8Q42_02575 [Nanoarchaeota archaeon]|nr:hypothetical protein [Nanoarchaeota archaeon]
MRKKNISRSARQFKKFRSKREWNRSPKKVRHNGLDKRKFLVWIPHTRIESLTGFVDINKEPSSIQVREAINSINLTDSVNYWLDTCLLDDGDVNKVYGRHPNFDEDIMIRKLSFLLECKLGLTREFPKSACVLREVKKIDQMYFDFIFDLVAMKNVNLTDGNLEEVNRGIRKLGYVISDSSNDPTKSLFESILKRNLRLQKVIYETREKQHLSFDKDLLDKLKVYCEEVSEKHMTGTNNVDNLLMASALERAVSSGGVQAILTKDYGIRRLGSLISGNVVPYVGKRFQINTAERPLSYRQMYICSETA